MRLMPLALVNLWLVGCASLFCEAQDSNHPARTEVRLLIAASEAKPGSPVMVEELAVGNSGLGGGFEIALLRWN
ncbi:MAG: hypothetical protein P8M70_04970 [Verrucomicrobiota bacterium]|nr:hypothetical protein [Verrucomicrobiota bacterium]